MLWAHNSTKNPRKVQRNLDSRDLCMVKRHKALAATNLSSAGECTWSQVDIGQCRHRAEKTHRGISAMGTAASKNVSSLWAWTPGVPGSPQLVVGFSASASYLLCEFHIEKRRQHSKPLVKYPKAVKCFKNSWSKFLAEFHCWAWQYEQFISSPQQSGPLTK